MLMAASNLTSAYGQDTNALRTFSEQVSSIKLMPKSESLLKCKLLMIIFVRSVEMVRITMDGKSFVNGDDFLQLYKCVLIVPESI